MNGVNYTSRPPKTARVSRKIWDLLRLEFGQQPSSLWLNPNGKVWGLSLGDAWYSMWFYEMDGHSELRDTACAVPGNITRLAGATNHWN